MSESIKNNSQEIEIDLSYLNEIACGSVEFMIDMINIFLEQTPLYMEQLIAAVNQQDWKTVGDVAHKIKPTLAFMGVNSAKDTMAEIERKARALSSLETIAEEVEGIGAVISNLYSRLEQTKVEFESQL
ncbi:Hpt domain-containing protein [Rubrolithibacter danxiaensis]|uniref:Hpt domain-containing protein n=1 Tax=Rubrolithibacter danxiaensis TaxID=3390805 RepID=UPI003BF84A76